MNHDASPKPRILGSLRSADGAGVVRIEDRYDTDIDDLWSAITAPRRLARWFGHVDGELSPGGEFRVQIADAERTGQVETCEPPRQLVVKTRETDESYSRGQGVPPFDAVWEITLTPDGDQTVLAIEVKGMPLDKIAFFGAGWQIHAENLGAYVAGRDLDDLEARWETTCPPLSEFGDQHQLTASQESSETRPREPRTVDRKGRRSPSSAPLRPDPVVAGGSRQGRTATQHGRAACGRSASAA